MTTRRYVFLDWISLTEPAEQVTDDGIEALEVLTANSTASGVKDAFGRLSLAIEGIGEADWRYDYASKLEFLHSSRRELATDPASGIIAKFLQTEDARNTATVAISNAGFVSVVIDCEGAATAPLLRIEEDRMESIAALLVRMTEIAATGKPSNRYVDPAENEFELSPFGMVPLRIGEEMFHHDTIGGAAEKALRMAELVASELWRRPGNQDGLLENRNALLGLGQRYIGALNRTIRQVEDTTTKTDGYKILERIKRVLGYSIVALAGIFFILIFLPSLDIFPLENFNPPKAVVIWIFVLFLALCLEIALAVWGLRRLFDARPDTGTGALYNPFSAATHARLLFKAPWVLPLVVALFLVFSIGLFWSKEWFGDRWLPTFASVWFQWLKPTSLPSLGVSSPSYGTFTEILIKAVWTLPAIGIGVLKYSYDQVTETVLGSQENRRYQSILEKLDTVLAAGRLYIAQFRNLFRLPYPDAPPAGSDKEKVSNLSLQLPSFDRLTQRIEAEKARISTNIDEAKSRFNRSTALTAALVGALVALEPLQQLKPDEPKPRDEDIAGVISNVYGNFGNFSTIPDCKPVVGDKCTAAENAAYTTAYALRSHLEEISTKIGTGDGGSGSLTAEAVAEAVISAMDKKGTLRIGVRDGVIDALSLSPKAKTGGTGPTGIETTITEAIIAALKDERIADIATAKAIERVVKDATVGALQDERIAALPSNQGIRKFAQDSVREAIRDILRDPVKTEIDVSWKKKEAVLAEIATTVQLAINAAVEKANIPSKTLTFNTSIGDPPDGEIKALAGRIAAAVSAALVEFLKTPLTPEVSITWKNKEDVLKEIGKTVQAAIDEAVKNASIPAKDLALKPKLDLSVPDLTTLAGAIEEAVRRSITAGLGNAQGRPPMNVAVEHKGTIEYAFTAEQIKAIEEFASALKCRETANTVCPPINVEKLGELLARNLPIFPSLPISDCKPLANVYFQKPAFALPGVRCVRVHDKDGNTKLYSRSEKEGDSPSECVESKGRHTNVLMPLLSEVSSRWNEEANKTLSQVLVVGLADSTGMISANLDIATKRANSLKAYLNRDGIRIAAIGRGEEVRSGEFSSGILVEDAESRRADIYLCPPLKPKPPRTQAAN